MFFKNLEYFYLLVFLIVYLFLFFKYKKKIAIQISVFEDLKKAQHTKFLPYLKSFNNIILVLIIVFFILTLARPQGTYEKQEVSKKGIDIIMALDVSESMLAEDLKPNRMEVAKENIQYFIDKTDSDRLGIIIFSGQAFTQSPLTFDYNILQEYLEKISVDSINQKVRGLNGTAIGDAILSAINRFKQSKERSKVLILLTDGDANTGVDPFIAAKKAQQENIKIYTIGIGREGGAPLPVYDILGNKSYAKNRDGSLFMATFKEENLKKIASITYGKYFRAGDISSFNKIMDEIHSLEKQEITVNFTKEYREKFMFYLQCLLGLMCLYIFIYTYKIVLR